ncbi:hypothetical protein LCGC14_2565120 [marine sediment metagenome]|uniref:Uncharacterized protein n=1 Tax=marine sediment metagenome TaxID=412755 RepID=A0A0F9CV26_9ZZZZ
MEKEDLVEFLEKKQLYTKIEIDPNEMEIASDFPNVNINLPCKICKDTRTFQLKEKALFMDDENNFVSVINEESAPIEPKDRIFFRYTCAFCKKFDRDFLIRIDESGYSIRKIGQYPPFNIDIPKELQGIMGKYEEFFKKGRIQENFTNGIGAYAYYRRIVEGIIDDLLERIPKLMTGDQRKEFEVNLIKAKKETRAKKKIGYVKDLIPESLKQGGYNPLQLLYEALSIGIHVEEEDVINDNATLIRETLEYLFVKIIKDEKNGENFKKNLDSILKKLKKA